MRGFEVGKTARCDGTPRIAIDGVLKTCEQIVEMADNLRKPSSSVTVAAAKAEAELAEAHAASDKGG